ncbi:MAG TPA: Gfo/Idh/MocA family oxidoreductase [Opitutaceae bacterium]|nr:Gfo/Idh/MocA family oxidoreductase [Opitutaceae bacterium]
MHPSRKIRWGVLGYARIARESLIPALGRSSNSEFRALGSRDPAKLAECAPKYPGVRMHRGYEEVLKDPEVDAVYIPLPNSQHKEWTIRAAEHGKHVLCEKPLALNAAEGREMAAACAARGVLLMEAFMYRYTERTRMALEIVRSGALGGVRFVHSSFRFLLAKPDSIKLQPELGGGSLYDVGVYPINFAGLVADTIAGRPAASRPEVVAATCGRTPAGVDDIFSAVVRYPDGLVASLHSGFNAHRRVSSEIVGTEGLLEIPDTFFDNAGSLTLTQGERVRELAVPESDRYRREVEDFAAAILERRPPLLGLEESIRNLETLDRLYAAVRD